MTESLSIDESHVFIFTFLLTRKNMKVLWLILCQNFGNIENQLNFLTIFYKNISRD